MNVLPSFPAVVPKLRSLLKESRFLEAERLISGYLENNEPDAWFWYASFPVQGATAVETDLHWIGRLWRACYLGSVEAKFEIAVDLDSGGIQGEDKGLAARMFEAAANEGHPRAAFIHGCALLHGTGGFMRDRIQGRKLLEYASHMGIVEAADELRGEECEDT